MTRPAYRYRVSRKERVIDGDTYVLHLDLGFHITHRTTVRLLGWSCPELRQPLGREAQRAADELLNAAGTIIVETEKDAQSFARWIARVWIDGRELGELLEARGLAVRGGRVG